MDQSAQTAGRQDNPNKKQDIITKLINANQTSSSGRWEYTEHVPGIFKQQLETGWTSIPRIFRTLLLANEFKLVSAELMLKALPHLKEVPCIPDDGDERTSWNQSAGICSRGPSGNYISVTAYSEDKNSGKKRASELDHALLHETGHGVWHSFEALFGKTIMPIIQRSYESDIELGEMPPPKYYNRQNRNLSRDETLAELFVGQIGERDSQFNGLEDSTTEFKNYFPSTQRLTLAIAERFEDMMSHSTPEQIRTYCKNEWTNILALSDLLVTTEQLCWDCQYTNFESQKTIATLQTFATQSFKAYPSHTLEVLSNYVFGDRGSATADKRKASCHAAISTGLHLIENFAGAMPDLSPSQLHQVRTNSRLFAEAISKSENALPSDRQRAFQIINTSKEYKKRTTPPDNIISRSTIYCRARSSDLG